MAKLIPQLTDRQISKAKYSEGNLGANTLRDGRGLELQITKASKLWRFRFKCPFTGKAAVMALGRYPEVSLSKARDCRQKYLSFLADGKDPRKELASEKLEIARKTSLTVAKVAQEWYDSKCPEWAESTQKSNAGLLRRFITDAPIGKFPIHEITRQQLIAPLKRIESKGNGSKYGTARKVKTIFEGVFMYAWNHGYIEVNIGNKLASVLTKHTKGHFPALTPEELPELMEKIYADRRMKKTTKIALYLMVLTFVRLNELICAEWEEIDFENRVWIVPWYKTKSGSRAVNPDKTNHVIPLSSQALNLLTVMKQISGGGKYVFPHDKDPRRHMSNNALGKALRDMGYSGRMTVHGFRTTSMSSLTDGIRDSEGNISQYTKDVVHIQLAHKQKGLDAVYNRFGILYPERCGMMQAWGDYIDSISPISITERNISNMKFHCQQALGRWKKSEKFIISQQ